MLYNKDKLANNAVKFFVAIQEKRFQKLLTVALKGATIDT
jgi:hypothetical protein